VGDGDDEEAVAAVGNTGKGVVPSSKGSQKTEETTGLDDRRVGLASIITLDVTDTEKQEREVEEQEQQEESDGGPQGAEEHDGGEDEPALGTLSAPSGRDRIDETLTMRNKPNEL
jgi:hypothetical protein